MFLGIEIGGTKLQLAVGDGTGSPPVALERDTVDPDLGAAGIMERIETIGTALLQRHQVERIGIGFGGPVDSTTGVTITSHQIAGWDNIPLGDWCHETLGAPCMIDNDCNVAALAEAKFGAGRHARRVFYVTVGTGIGGGLVVDGTLYGDGRPAVAEIGHLRPGLHADRAEETVESLASGWGIAAGARSRLSGGLISRSLGTVRREDGPNDPQWVRQRIANADQADREYAADLSQRCDGNTKNLTAKMVMQAASEGNELAREVLAHAHEALGWAIAQTITLLAPEVIVVGGGVSLAGEQLFFEPLKAQVARYVFPPLAESYAIRPAELGEEVVLHGALALAAAAGEKDGSSTAGKSPKTKRA